MIPKVTLANSRAVKKTRFEGTWSFDRELDGEMATSNWDELFNLVQIYPT